MGTSIRQFIPIDAGNHHVAQFHLRRHVGHIGWFQRIQAKILLAGIAFGDGTEAAAPGAEVAVAYISNVFQKRAEFLANLKAEWREIIATKSALLGYMHKSAPSHDEYVTAFTQLSETIDNMRIVYRNVGETRELIGLYPFAPLHDMRRVMQSLDPRKGNTTEPQRKLARDTMLQSFFALRDRYLEELDLEAPDSPIVMAGARRLRVDGFSDAARARQASEISEQRRRRPIDDDHDRLLQETNENNVPKIKPVMAAE